jgi:hypothetical protein
MDFTNCQPRKYMPKNNAGSFFARMRQMRFEASVNWEIFQKLSPHKRGEANYGYSFDTSEEMNAETERFNVREILDRIEEQTKKMGKGYGESFRYLMHRDLRERLKMWEAVGHPRIGPDWSQIDPRLIATHA